MSDWLSDGYCSRDWVRRYEQNEGCPDQCGVHRHIGRIGRVGLLVEIGTSKRLKVHPVSFFWYWVQKYRKEII